MSCSQNILFSRKKSVHFSRTFCKNIRYPARMHPDALLAWVALGTGLFLKYVVLTSIQGKRRFALRTFRWPEDAAAWNGTVMSGQEDATIERCQAVLRNDAETQPLLLAFSAAWVFLGVPAIVAGASFGTYFLARCVHAYFLVHPRQPLRNRAFVVSQLVFLGIVIDVIRRAILAV